MVFANDTVMALSSAVALVNSMGGPDTLLSPADVEEIFETFAYTGRHDGDTAELAAVRGIRPRLRALLVAEEEAAVRLLNDILAEARAVPQLVRHDALAWHIHAIEPGAPLAERILVETAMAMVDLIRGEELSRLSVCADDECQGIVLDLSRNRSRRYCTTTCANRNAVAAYRARRAAAD